MTSYSKEKQFFTEKKFFVDKYHTFSDSEKKYVGL